MDERRKRRTVELFTIFFLKIDSSAWNERIATVQILKFRVSSVDWRKTIIDRGQKFPESKNEPKRVIFTNFFTLKCDISA